MKALPLFLSIMHCIQSPSAQEQPPSTTNQPEMEDLVGPDNCGFCYEFLNPSTDIINSVDSNIIACKNIPCSKLCHRTCLIKNKMAKTEDVISKEMQCIYCYTTFTEHLPQTLIKMLLENAENRDTAVSLLFEDKSVPAFKFLYDKNMSVSEYEEIYKALQKMEFPMKQNLLNVWEGIFIIKKYTSDITAEEISNEFQKLVNTVSSEEPLDDYHCSELFDLHFIKEHTLQEGIAFMKQIVDAVIVKKVKRSTDIYHVVSAAFFKHCYKPCDFEFLLREFAFTKYSVLFYSAKFEHLDAIDLCEKKINMILLHEIKTKNWVLDAKISKNIEATFLFIKKMIEAGLIEPYTFINDLSQFIISLRPSREYDGQAVPRDEDLVLFVDQVYEKDLHNSSNRHILRNKPSNGYPWFFFDYALTQHILCAEIRLVGINPATLFCNISRAELKVGSEKVTYLWLKTCFKYTFFSKQEYLLLVVQRFSHMLMSCNELLLRHAWESHTLKKCFDCAVAGRSPEYFKMLLTRILPHSDFIRGVDSYFKDDYSAFEKPKIFCKSIKILQFADSKKIDSIFKKLIKKEHYKDVQLLIFVSRDVNLIKSLTAKQRQKILASNVFRYCY
ncbi:hypothetical protein ENBRE01_2711, partial [Enteropsectra breve]